MDNGMGYAEAPTREALEAAAPALYAALCDIMYCIDIQEAYSCAYEHDAARAAIARAEGR